ncbi:hypothetical protein ACOMHN_044011 [Nucella lapillus]
MLFCSAFLCQGVSSFIAKHVAVGGHPLQGDCVTCAEGGERGGQIVEFWISVGPKSLQDGQGVGQEDNVVAGVGAGADLNVGCWCFQGFCFGSVVGGVQAGSESYLFFSASWILNPAPPFLMASAAEPSV